MRKLDTPYRFRACKGRAISVEFRFMPGKRISTGCYDMPSAVIWTENYLKNMGHQASEHMPTIAEEAKGFFMRTDKDSFVSREKAFGRERTPGTLKKMQQCIDSYVVPAFGNMLVTAITQRMVEDWLLSFKGRNGRMLANNTRNKALTSFRYLMDDICRKGYRNDNPARDAKKMADNTKEREAIPPDQLLVLFPDSPDERISVWGSLMWAVYFSIFYDTGMRPGEIAALRVCDIYSTPNGLAVKTVKEVSSSERKIVERVKTTGKGYSKRVMLLYEDTAGLLLRLISSKGLSGEDMLFHAPRNEDRPLIAETSNKHFKSVLSRYGFMHPGIVQYCMRHTYETERKGDLPNEVLAVSMGHTKLRKDYDHQTEIDIIRFLEEHREGLFRNRERLGRESDIIPLEEALKRKAPQPSRATGQNTKKRRSIGLQKDADA